MWSYARAGVDLSKHRDMHRYALEKAMELARELGVSVGELEGYAPHIALGSTRLVLHVDGVGTKALVLDRLRRYDVIGWDCVAMNVNDVVCNGAKPIALVDYIALPRDDVELFKMVFDGIVKAARMSRVPVIGGETAILRDLVQGIDAVCCVLAIKERNFINRARIGDVLIGVESSGLHANGYTLVRKVLESRGIDYSAVIDGIDLGYELSKPTAIYSNLVLEAIDRELITAAAHITGGAFTKLRRILCNGCNFKLSMPRPPRIFELIQSLGGIATEEMYRVFNMGIGLVVAAPRDRVDEFVKLAKQHGFNSYILGETVSGSNRIEIEVYTGERIEF